MRTLRELSQDMEQLLAAIALNEGELTDEIAAQYDATKEQIEQKVEDYATFIATLKGEAETLEAEIERLTAMKKSKTKLVDRLKNNLLYNLNAIGMDKVKTDFYSVGIRKSKFVIVDPCYLSWVGGEPDMVEVKKKYPFIRIKLEVDKSALAAHAKNGGEMPDWAQMVENESLSIR